MWDGSGKFCAHSPAFARHLRNRMGADGHWGHVTTPVKIGGQANLPKGPSQRKRPTTAKSKSDLGRIPASFKVATGIVSARTLVSPAGCGRQELSSGKVRPGVSFGRPNEIVRCVEVSLEVVDGFDAFFVGQIADGGKFLAEGLAEQFLIPGLRDQRLGCGSFHNSNSRRG